MTRLTFVRPADDGEHLIVATESGEEFELVLSDDVRRAAHTVRPRPAATAEPGEDAPEPGLTPREIQQRIRAGLNAQELAELTGEPVEFLEKYEGPVLAEREYITELARGTRIGRESDAPVLGELVTDRLASRGIVADAIAWDAWREQGEPWMVAADYRADGRAVRAQWSFDHTARAVTALDDESRWLTETELLDVPIPKRHLSAVRETKEDAAPLGETRPVMPVTEAVEAVEEEPSPTELLLDDLDLRRGTRDTVSVEDLDDEDDDDGGFEGFGPAVQRARQADVGFTSGSSGASMPHPAGSARREQPATDPDDDGETPSEPLGSHPDPEPDRKPARKGRASVPSWDEIVFGAKHE